MKYTLLTELENKFKEIEDSESEEDLGEANVTGNLDGGEGPPKMGGVFTNSEDDLDNDHIEVLGYKRTKTSTVHTKRLNELEKQLEDQILEISYRDYKNDDTRKDHQKINDSIKNINKMVYKVEQMVNQNLRLKKESGVSSSSYWKSTQSRFTKISERMIKISHKIKELNL